MSVLNDTNKGRVTKIVEAVALIEKSAISNKASQGELWELFDPAVKAIQSLLEPDSQPDGTTAPEPEEEASVAAPAPSRHKEARWSSIYDMAREAPLHELTRMVAVFLNRIDEHLDAQRPKGD